MNPIFIKLFRNYDCKGHDNVWETPDIRFRKDRPLLRKWVSQCHCEMSGPENDKDNWNSKMGSVSSTDRSSVARMLTLD